MEKGFLRFLRALELMSSKSVGRKPNQAFGNPAAKGSMLIAKPSMLIAPILFLTEWRVSHASVRTIGALTRRIDQQQAAGPLRLSSGQVCEVYAGLTLAVLRRLQHSYTHTLRIR